MFNRPKEPSAAHAGVLLALGLRGHLSVLTNTDLYRYLVQEHDATTVAALLGVAAARRGSARADAAKMCFLHLPAIHPAAFPEVELSLNAQSAALAAVGLLYQGTAHRRTVEIALAEIGRDPGGGGNAESDAHASGGREGALAAGRARPHRARPGADAVGLADLRVVERLGATSAPDPAPRDRPRGPARSGTRPAPPGAAAHVATTGPLGTAPPGSARDERMLICSRRTSAAARTGGRWRTPTRRASTTSWTGSRRRRSAVVWKRTRSTATGGTKATPRARGAGGASANGQVMQGSAVNVDATSPGAALALGLMFLRTGDAAAAASLDLPATRYALDHVRPDFVLTRVVAKALILWHDIEPTTAWMETRLPPLLRPPLSRTKESAFFDAARHGEAGTSERLPRLGTCFDAFPADDGSDREALAQAHVHALAGACMALGLRFAGTADASARDALRGMLSRFLSLKAAAAAGEPCGGWWTVRRWRRACASRRPRWRA